MVVWHSPREPVQSLSITQLQAGLDLSMDVFKEVNLLCINILCEGEAYI